MEIEVKKNMKRFAMFLKILCNNSDEIILTATPELLKCRIKLAGSQVVKVNFSPDFFDKYEVEGEQSFGVFVKDVLAVLKIAKTELTLTEKDNTLVAQSGKTKFAMPLLADVGEMKEFEPSFTHDLGITTSFDNFMDGLSKAKMSGDNAATFKTEGGKLIMSSQDGPRKVDIEIADTGYEGLEVSFSIKILESLLDKGDEPIKLNLSNDTPIKIEHSQDGALLQAYVAPMV